MGDDVYGEDPTVNRMEALVAEMLGKEAAVYVPSGTMGNLISVLSHCNRGDEMILGDQNHIFLYEQGGAAAVGGVQPRTVRNRPDGTQDLDEMAAAIRGDNEHYPITALIAVENTHNRCGGRACRWTTWTVGNLAHAHGLKLHVDGARLWHGGGAGRTAGPGCPGRGLGERLSEQGAGRAGGVGGRGRCRVHPAGAAHAQAGGRRHASGRRSGRGGHRCAHHHGGPAGRGPRACQATGPRSGPSGRRRPGPGRGGDRHRLL
ncbi:MAG: GntG family PLP-dependent aldolase [Caldilineaceae bacterium]